MMAIILIGYYVRYPSQKVPSKHIPGQAKSNTWDGLWEQLGAVTVALWALSQKTSWGLEAESRAYKGGKTIVYGVNSLVNILAPLVPGQGFLRKLNKCQSFLFE